MSEQVVKPCPFCGSDGVQSSRIGGAYDPGAAWVECVNETCGAKGEEFEYIEDVPSDPAEAAAEAVKWWNRRPPLEPIYPAPIRKEKP